MQTVSDVVTINALCLMYTYIIFSIFQKPSQNMLPFFAKHQKYRKISFSFSEHSTNIVTIYGLKHRRVYEKTNLSSQNFGSPKKLRNFRYHFLLCSGDFLATFIFVTIIGADVHRV